MGPVIEKGERLDIPTGLFVSFLLLLLFMIFIYMRGTRQERTKAKNVCFTPYVMRCLAEPI